MTPAPRKPGPRILTGAAILAAFTVGAAQTLAWGQGHSSRPQMRPALDEHPVQNPAELEAFKKGIVA